MTVDHFVLRAQVSDLRPVARHLGMTEVKKRVAILLLSNVLNDQLYEDSESPLRFGLTVRGKLLAESVGLRVEIDPWGCAWLPELYEGESDAN